jgi:hypothetical protein
MFFVKKLNKLAILFSKVSSIKLTLKHTHNYGQRKFPWVN